MYWRLLYVALDSPVSYTASMQEHRVEQRNVKLVLLEHESQLGTAQNNTLCTLLNQPPRRLEIHILGLIREDVLGQLVENGCIHAVHECRVREKHLETMLLLQPTLDEITLHRRLGAEEGNLPEPGLADRVGAEINDVQERDPSGFFYSVGKHVVGVDAQHNGLGANRLELRSGDAEHTSDVLKLTIQPGVHDLVKVEGLEDDFG